MDGIGNHTGVPLKDMMSSNNTAGKSQEILISNKQRLSQCAIWPMLEEFYKTGGKGLWENVPYYVTSSAFIADVYAELIISFLTDCYASLQKEAPIYIVEMGTGTGCLSFLLMKELERKLKCFPLIEALNIKYVMADFSQNTLDDWLRSEELQHFRNSGLLDVAIFKPEEQDTITTHDGVVLSSATIQNPIIAIANYFFDSLRQDAFQVRKHRLAEVLHTFYYEHAYEKEDENGPFALLKKRENYEWINEPYYDHSVLDSVLKSYESEFEDATFVFPLGAFKTLDNLRTMSNNKLVLLSTDKGYTDHSYMLGLWQQPFVAHHGVYSYSVNYDAIGKYFKQLGGFAMDSNVLAYSVETQMAVLFDEYTPEKMPLSVYHFNENVARKNSINYLYYAQNILSPEGTCSKNDMVRAYISFVRSCSSDPIALYMCGEALAASVSELNSDLRTSLVSLLDDVEENFYHVRNRTDALYMVGKIRYMIDDFEGCQRAMEHSVRVFGDNSHSLYYLAACAEVKNNFELALAHYSRSLFLDPSCELTRKAVERVAKKAVAVEDGRL